MENSKFKNFILFPKKYSWKNILETVQNDSFSLARLVNPKLIKENKINKQNHARFLV